MWFIVSIQVAKLLGRTLAECWICKAASRSLILVPLLILTPGAAQRFPDKVDKDPEGARALNIAASRLLANLAAGRDIFVIYISTDYVFPGKPGDAPYEADATPNPTNLYGQTKLDGERAVLDEYAKVGKEGSAVVLRVPVLYGHAETPSESAVNVLMDSVWKGQTEDAKFKMDHWSLRYPTNTEDVGRVCHGMSHYTSLFTKLGVLLPQSLALPPFLKFLFGSACKRRAHHGLG